MDMLDPINASVDGIGVFVPIGRNRRVCQAMPAVIRMHNELLLLATFRVR